MKMHVVRPFSVVLVLALAATGAWAHVEADLAAATSAGRAVFLIVSEGASPQLATARSVANQARELAPGTSVLELDRGDPAAAATVRRYRLGSVPVPMILVIAPNGVAAGGARPEATTAARLAAMIPGPGKAAYLKALEERKAPLLVFTRASMPERAGAVQAARAAVGALKGAAVAIEVDLDAAPEAAFVKELRVDAKTTVPWVAVYNAKGRPTATYTGVPKVEDLATAATKEVEAPCCPGGQCGPEGRK